MNEKLEHTFVFVAFGALLVMLLWKARPSIPAVSTAPAVDATDSMTLDPRGAAFLTYNQPMMMPQPLAMMTLPATSVAAPAPAVNSSTGCNTCN